MKKLVVTCLLIACSSIFAQLQIEWETILSGNPTTRYTEAKLSKLDSQGNIYIASQTWTTNNNNNALLAKLDNAGNIVWEKIYDIGSDDEPIGIEFDDSDNVVFAVRGIPLDSTNNKYDLHMIMYDSDGNELYNKSIKWYQEVGIWNELFNIAGLSSWMKEDKYGRFVLGGGNWRIMLDKNSEFVSKNYHTLPVDTLAPYNYLTGDTYLSSGNGYIYGGLVRRNEFFIDQNCRFSLYCINHAGEWEWIKPILYFNGFHPSGNLVSSIANKNDQSMIMALNFMKEYGTADIRYSHPHLIKINSDGDLVWDVTLPEEGENDTRTIFSQIAYDASGNIWATGVIDYKFFVAKYSGAGQLIWRKIDPELQDGWYDANVICDGDNGIIAAPDNNGNFVIRKYDEFGNALSEIKVEGISVTIPVMDANLMIDDNSNIYFHAEIGTGSGTAELVTLKITNGATNLHEQSSTFHNFKLNQNFPNPYNPSTKITYQLKFEGNVLLEVYDIIGRKVQTLVDSPKSAGQHSVNFDGSSLPTGVYFYQLKVSDHRGISFFTQSNKMLLLK